MVPDPRIPSYLGRVLYGDDPAGTCFQVAPGVLVTAWHVLDALGAGEEGAVVRVDLLRGGSARQGRVARADSSRDLAVLVTDELTGKTPLAWRACGTSSATVCWTLFWSAQKTGTAACGLPGMAPCSGTW